jgi:phage FluMu gp28-like protein
VIAPQNKAPGRALPEGSPLRELVDAGSYDAPPPVLMVYQQEWVADQAQVKIAEKGRRVGLTWAEAADDVLQAATEGGSNVFYISATQDMAREYIEACAQWARAFDYAASEIAEGLYDDGTDAADPAKRFIKTYELVLPGTGRRIVALSSRPTNLRGKQGIVVIDEAAFAPSLALLLKAAMAMTLWGDKVRIISTHDGVENEFAQLIADVRAGKMGEATVHRIPFDRAVADGLYTRVCLRKGLEWTAEGQAKWVKAARDFYRDNAGEELDAIPSSSTGAYLSLALIQERMVAPGKPGGPVIVRNRWDDAFAYLPEDVRRHAIKGWFEEAVRPHLVGLNKLYVHVIGEDFARSQDLTVITVLEQDSSLISRPVLTIELGNCPFSSQQQILFDLVDSLPRFRGGAMDATGNGAALAEAAAQRYGVEMIEQVKLSESFYLAHMPKLKAALQDGTLVDLARDEQHQSDLRAIQLVRGVPRVPPTDTQSAGARAAAAEGGEKQRRHGDFAIALFMAVYALTRECGEIDWTPIPGMPGGWEVEAPRGSRLAMRPDTSSDGMHGLADGWKSGW